MEADKELWKDIEGYEGLYKISSYGNVLSLKYCGSNREHLLAPNPDHKGYLMVYLSKRGKTKTFKIHRLVASAFIPNPHTLPQVNHKDEDKSNNSVENLEWCTQGYNNSYGNRTRKMLETYKNRHTSNAEKEVIQMSIDGTVLRTYKSLSEAARISGVSLGNLSNVCNKKSHRKTLGGLSGLSKKR